MFKTISYIAQYEAEEIIPIDNQIIISITDFEHAKLSHLWKEEHILRTNFADIKSKDKFTKNHAKLIIKWLTSFENNDEITDVIVHCFAGASRSAAVAKFIAKKYNLKFDDEYKFYNMLMETGNYCS